MYRNTWEGERTVPAVQRLWWQVCGFPLNIQQCKTCSDDFIPFQTDLLHSKNWIAAYCMSLMANFSSGTFSRKLGTTSILYSPHREASSVPHQHLAPPSRPLAYGGGTEGRKRRSPSTYRGKASKLSRPDGLESLFGNGNDSGGILASGPESPRQVTVIYRLSLCYPLVGVSMSMIWCAHFWMVKPTLNREPIQYVSHFGPD